MTGMEIQTMTAVASAPHACWVDLYMSLAERTEWKTGTSAAV